VTGHQHVAYPEDATLPLPWIRDRLAAARAEQGVVVVSARGDGAAPSTWLCAPSPRKPRHVIPLAAPPAGRAGPAAPRARLCGDALDPRTGTVTMKSLSQQLARHCSSAAIQHSDASETVATSPPLAGLWDVRRSQLSTRTGFRHAADGSEDLTGSVLPG